MNVLIAGASGFVGHAVVAGLRSEGHRVQRLVRRDTAHEDEKAWDPARQRLDPQALQGIDAIINLAGENLSAGRWTAARRQRILRSRVDATDTLVNAIRAAPQKPEVLINASAVGFYGDRGDETLTEQSSSGQGFLPDVCRAWESAAETAGSVGVRTVCLRFGLVLDPSGGALGRLLPLFRMGLGGRLGSGRQWMSWISREDVVGVIRFALADRRVAGPLNVVAPEPIRNADFTRALGHVLHRPAILPAPAWALRLAFGAMADEALLASTRAVPAKLQSLGFRFRTARVEDAVR
jgi:uncharacterized protein (TIGR01777 family)